MAVGRIYYTLSKNGVLWQRCFFDPDSCWKNHFGGQKFTVADIVRLMDLGYEVVTTRWSYENYYGT